jgi:hypothetical protein
MCEDAGIPVMRIGLQANSALDGGSVLAGPYHPAFGFFVRVHWWRLVVNREISRLGVGEGARVLLSVPRRFLYECCGPQNINRRFWIKRWNLAELDVKFFLPENNVIDRAFSIDLFL